MVDRSNRWSSYQQVHFTQPAAERSLQPENLDASFCIYQCQGGKWGKEQQKPPSSVFDLFLICGSLSGFNLTHYIPLFPINMSASTQTQKKTFRCRDAFSHLWSIIQHSRDGRCWRCIMYSLWILLLWLCRLAAHRYTLLFVFIVSLMVYQHFTNY